MEKLAIEKEKVGILIGKKGASKRLIEKELAIRLIVSKNGEITIKGDAMQTFLACTVIEAISLGFSVKDALKLKDTEHVLERIDIKSFAKSKTRIKEIKGRLIGTAGRAKKTIQDLADVLLSVSDTKVGIIGKIEDVALAKEAIQALLKGAKHGRIFKWLEHRGRYFHKAI